MATKALPQGSCNFPVNMPREMRRQLGRLAFESDMSTGEYIRRLIEPAVRNGIIFAKASAKASIIAITITGFAAVCNYSLTPNQDLRRAPTRIVARGVRKEVEAA